VMSRPTQDIAAPGRAGVQRMLDPGDLAEILGCSRRTVIRRCETGKLPRPAVSNGYNFHRWTIQQIERWQRTGDIR